MENNTFKQNTFVLKEDGKIVWIEKMPEVPSLLDCQNIHFGKPDSDSGRMLQKLAYKQALQSAIANAVEVSNQIHVKDHINPFGAIGEIEVNKPYTLNCRVEIKQQAVPCPDGIEGCMVLHSRAVAHVTFPEDKPEQKDTYEFSQQKGAPGHCYQAQIFKNGKAFLSIEPTANEGDATYMAGKITEFLNGKPEQKRVTFDEQPERNSTLAIAAKIAESVVPKLSENEQAMFIAGFIEHEKWLKLQPEQNKTAEANALQEAKQQVAKKNQFPTWQDLLDTYKDRFNVACIVHEQHAYQLAHFYASQQTASLQKQVEELNELLDEANGVRMCHADHEVLLLKRIELLESALQKIANPIGYLKQEAEKEGGQLNGYAFELSNNASWLKTIAKETLEALTKEPKQ